MLNRILVLTLIFLSFDLRFVIANAKSMEDVCRQIFKNGVSGHCYNEQIRTACKKQCDEYRKNSTKDCPFGDAIDGKYDCAKEITKKSCNTKCSSSNKANEVDRVAGVNCCGTCQKICKDNAPRKI